MVISNKKNSFSKNNYLHNCYINLIRSNIIHILLIVIETSLTLTQELDIYYRSYEHRTTVIGNQTLSPSLMLVLKLDKLSVNQKMYLLIIPIIILDVVYFFYRYYKVEQKGHVSIIIINFLELFYFRMYVLIYLNLLFSLPSFQLYFLFFFNLYHCYILLSNFMSHHLFYYVPKFIKYPYDEFSAIYDLYHFICKFLVSISTMALDSKLCKFCFIVLFLLEIFFAVFAIYIAFYKSYLLMMNPLYNKIRFSLSISMCFVPLILYLFDQNKITLIMVAIFIIILLIIFLFLILYLYDPFKQVHFQPINYDENIYYFFILKENNKFSNFSLENKIIEHITSCGKCFFCKKCSEGIAKFEEVSKNLHDDNDLFNLLLNKKNEYLVLMNYIVYDYLKNGIESLYNNPYYHINLLYYYFKDLEKNNTVLALNELLILDMLNDGNKINIDGNKAAINILLLVNEFLISVKNFINEMEDILFNLKGKEKVKKIITLSETTKDLNSKKFRKILIGHKIESSINCSQLVFICSILYEEIFNTELSSSRIPLRDNLQSLEDIFNFSFKNNKIISLKVSLITFNCTIIRAGREFTNYINTNLYNLFPNNFRIHQAKLFENGILSLKRIKKNLLKKKTKLGSSTITNHVNFKKKKYNRFSKTNEKTFDIFLIIESRIDKTIYYKILRMRLFLLYNNEIKDFIILNGMYHIEKNSIITTFKKNNITGIEEEIIYGVSDENLLNNNFENNSTSSQISQSLATMSNSLKLKDYNLKLVQIYHIGITKYNIYLVIEKPKKKGNFQKNDNDSKKQLIRGDTTILVPSSDYDDDDVENENNKKPFEFEDTGSVASQQSSIGTERSSGAGAFSRSKNRKGNDNIISSEGFFRAQKFIFVFMFLLIVFTIFFIFYFNSLKGKVKLLNDSYALYRNFCRYYYKIISTIPALICIPRNVTELNCENYLNILNKEYSNLYPDENFNFTIFIIEQNKILVDKIVETKQSLTKLSSVLGEKKFNEIFTKKIVYLGISKVEGQNSTFQLDITIRILDFIDVLSLIINTFQIFMKDESYILEKPLFLLSAGISPFENLIKENRDLSEFQATTYIIILNCLGTYTNLTNVNLEFSKILTEETNMLSTYFYILHHLNIVIILAILIVLFYYVNIINKVIEKVINSIDAKISYKSPQFDFSQLFSQKLEKLNILLTIYTKDPVNLLTELNDVYGNYTRYTSELRKKKIKELYGNHTKKNINVQENEEENEDSLLMRKNQLATNKILHQIGADSFYFNFLIFIVIITIILYFYIIIISLVRFNNSNLFHSLIVINNDVETSVYKSYNYLQHMIIGDFSLEEISQRSGVENILNKLSNDISEIFFLEKEKKKIKSKIKNLDDYISYNCEDIYNVKYDVLEEIYKKYPDKNYKQKLIKFCEFTQMASKGINIKFIIQKHYQDILNGMLSIKDRTYATRVKIIFSYSLSRFGMIFFSIVIYIIEISINKASDAITNYKLDSIDSLLSEIAFWYIIYEVILLAILIFVFIKKANNYFLQIFRLKKIFKICNSQDR